MMALCHLSDLALLLFAELPHLLPPPLISGGFLLNADVHEGAVSGNVV